MTQLPVPSRNSSTPAHELAIRQLLPRVYIGREAKVFAALRFAIAVPATIKHKSAAQAPRLTKRICVTTGAANWSTPGPLAAVPARTRLAYTTKAATKAARPRRNHQRAARAQAFSQARLARMGSCPSNLGPTEDNREPPRIARPVALLHHWF